MSQLEHIKAHAERLQAQLRTVRQQGAIVARRGIGVTATVGGGATSGLLEAYLPKVPGTEIESDMVMGAIITAAGVFGLTGSVDDQLADFGAGMLACVTSRGLRKAIGK